MAIVKEPRIVLEKGKPSFVLLDITEYETLLEKAEDAQDLKKLRRIKKQKTHFRPLSKFLKDYNV